MTEKQLVRQSKAGKASFRLRVLAALRDHPGDLDMAARHLTGSMRSLRFYGRRGVTTEYMRRWHEQFAQEGAL